MKDEALTRLDPPLVPLLGNMNVLTEGFHTDSLVGS